MPKKYLKRVYKSNSIHHVFNLGINGQNIFCDDSEGILFLSLVQNYLNAVSPHIKRKTYKERIKILCFCLMNNHFHMILQQKDPTALSEFMQGLAVRYVMRINKKHGRVGPLFCARFQSREIRRKSDLVNVSKYIHLNPTSVYEEARQYDFSSIRCYVGKNDESFSFVDTSIIMDSFADSKEDYEKFMATKQGPTLFGLFPA